MSPLKWLVDMVVDVDVVVEEERWYCTQVTVWLEWNVAPHVSLVLCGSGFVALMWLLTVAGV